MQRRKQDDQSEPLPDSREFEFPPDVPPTPEELQRRQRLLEEAERLRGETGSIGFSVVDIIRRYRDGGPDDGWIDELRADSSKPSIGYDGDRAGDLNLPAIPDIEHPSAEEIQGRREHFARTKAFRDRVGPIGIASDDLVHLARADTDGFDE